MNYYKRKINVSVGGLTFTNDRLRIDFTIPFDDDHTPNSATVRIYNLSPSSVAAIKKGGTCLVNAGYEGDVGQILKGKITDVYTDAAGTDRATHITVQDEQGTENKKTVEKSYKKGVSSQTIIQDVASAIGLKLKVVKLPNNKVHAKGYNASGKGVDIIKRLAEDCGASFYPILGEWYVRDILEGDNINFALSPSTGLLGIPQRMNKTYQNKEKLGWQIEALLQHRVRTAALLTLVSKTANGKFRVIGGRHEANGAADTFRTYLEVIH